MDKKYAQFREWQAASSLRGQLWVLAHPQAYPLGYMTDREANPLIADALLELLERIEALEGSQPRPPRS